MAVEMVKGLKEAGLITNVKPKNRALRISSASVNNNTKIYFLNGREITSKNILFNKTKQKTDACNLYIISNNNSDYQVKLLLVPATR